MDRTYHANGNPQYPPKIARKADAIRNCVTVKDREAWTAEIVEPEAPQMPEEMERGRDRMDDSDDDLLLVPTAAETNVVLCETNVLRETNVLCDCSNTMGSEDDVQSAN